MNRIFPYVGAAALLTQAASQWTYPPTKTVDASDTYFGKTYKDPYRWLEDLKDKDVEAWFKAQADLTDGLLAKIPARDALADEWMTLDKLQPATLLGDHVRERPRVLQEDARRRERRQALLPRGLERRGEAAVRPGQRQAEGRQGRRRHDHRQHRRRRPTAATSRSGFSAAGAEYSEIRIARRRPRGSCCPRACIRRTARPAGRWTASRSSTTPARSPTSRARTSSSTARPRLHRLGTAVATRRRLLQQRELTPSSPSTPKEFPSAYIDESYPDYVIGEVGTVQNEMRLFYAPTSQMKAGGRSKWTVLAQDVRQPGPRPRVPQGPGLRGHARRRAALQGRPHQPRAPRLAEGRDRRARGQGLDPVHHQEQELSLHRLLRRDHRPHRQVRPRQRQVAPSSSCRPRARADIYCPDFRTNQCIVFTTSWIQPTTL